jgi:hypothetical protein
MRPGPLSIAVIALVLLASPHAAPGQPLPLRGDMFVAGATVVDAPPNEPRDSHAYFSVHGAAALRMYRIMRGRAEDDLCRGNRRKIKRAGALSCSAGPGGREATCAFSIDLRSGRAAGGAPC